MFRSKAAATLQVIAVQSEKRGFKEGKYEKRISSYQGRVEDVSSDTKEYSHYVTIVLVVKGGEMYTKEFNGKWDLKDVKEWETANNG